MTFRQSEFARHYAQGKPAVKAALAAGYTKSTAETNAARLLKSPQIINEIRVNRNGLRIITIDDITRTMTRLMHIIDNSDNYAHVLQASAQLFRYLRFQPDVWPEYPDKIDKNVDIPEIPELDDDTAFTTHSTQPDTPEPTPQSPLGDDADQPMMQSWVNQPTPQLDNPDKSPDKKSVNYPLSTIHYQLPSYSRIPRIHRRPVPRRHRPAKPHYGPRLSS